MTLSSVLRSIDAANRRAARNHERAEKLRIRESRLRSQLAEAEFALLQAERFDETVENLTGIHREEPTFLDWEEILKSPPVPIPELVKHEESFARSLLENYKPSILDRILGKTEKKRAELAAEIESATTRDAATHRSKLEKYEQSKTSDERRRKLAGDILSGDIPSYEEALSFVNPLSDIIAAGSEGKITLPDRFTAEVELTVEGSKVVPSESVTLTRTGKLSTKAMPKTRFFELYQDYVCGCALRTAREICGVLPVRLVVVHVQTKIFNSGLGIDEAQTVLSVAIPRQALARMNFALCDASDSMANFIHRMGFKRSQGFSGIRPLDPHEYPTGENAAID